MPPPPADRSGRRRRLLVVGAAALGVGVLALLVALSDGRELVRTAAGIPPATLVAPMALALLSYAAMARSYQGIAAAAGARLPFRTWLRITIVSNTVAYLVPSGGLSGFAVRMYLLSQHGVRSGRAALVSLVQTLITNFTILLLILAGFATLVVRGKLHGGTLGTAAALLMVFAAVIGYAAVLVYRKRLRRLTLLFLTNSAHRILRRVVPHWTPRRVRLWRFQHSLNEGLEFLLERKDRMLAPTGWILLDWMLTLAILWCAFWAVRYPISPWLVLMGFSVGVLLTLVSFVPGGLGVMEGSMIAVFVGLGVPYESAFVAVAIFRVAYYVLPLLVSLFLFHGLMRQAAAGAVVPGV